MIQSENPDIVAITESWLHDNFRFLGFPGYSIFRQDRQPCRGGGVLLCVRTALRAELVSSGTIDTCEYIFVDVVQTLGKVRYGVIYPLKLLLRRILSCVR